MISGLHFQQFVSTLSIKIQSVLLQEPAKCLLSWPAVRFATNWFQKQIEHAYPFSLYNHRMSWTEKNLKDHPVSTHLPWTESPTTRPGKIFLWRAVVAFSVCSYQLPFWVNKDCFGAISTADPQKICEWEYMPCEACPSSTEPLTNFLYQLLCSVMFVILWLCKLERGQPVLKSLNGIWKVCRTNISTLGIKMWKVMIELLSAKTLAKVGDGSNSECNLSL